MFDPIDEVPLGVVPSKSFNETGTRGKLFLINHTQKTYISAGPSFSNCDACDRSRDSEGVCETGQSKWFYRSALTH